MDVEVDGLKVAAIDGCLAQRIDQCDPTVFEWWTCQRGTKGQHGALHRQDLLKSMVLGLSAGLFGVLQKLTNNAP